MKKLDGKFGGEHSITVAPCVLPDAQTGRGFI